MNMKKQCYRLLNAVLVLMMLFGLFGNAGFTAHADGVYLFATGLDGNSLLDEDADPTNPWTRCINLGPIKTGFDSTAAEKEKAKVYVTGDA